MKKLNRDKKTINIFKRTLSNNRGETLVEGIVSLLMLAILMAGAYAMITSSLSIISTAYENDKDFKIEINSVIEGVGFVDTENPEDGITFTIDGITSKVKYKLYNINGIVAFKAK